MAVVCVHSILAEWRQAGMAGAQNAAGRASWAMLVRQPSSQH